MSKRAVLGAAILALFAVTIFVTAGSYFAAFVSVATSPARVISSTMSTDNIIANYEFFHDAYQVFRARVGQISAHRDMIMDAVDPVEKSRLRMELAAMRQSCREIVGRYNANATKTNRAIFRGQEAPSAIDMSNCE